MWFSHFRQTLIAGVLFASCAIPARSELHVAAPNIDLGVVRGGQKLSQRFELLNRSAETVEILEIKRGCGCLATQIEQRRLAPGGKTVLTLELRTLGQADGPHTWGIDVQYRLGEEKKILALSVRGTVQSEITVQPAILGLHVTKSVEQEITLTDCRTKPLRVVDVDARAPGMRVTKIERAGKITKIVVNADGTKLTAGRHEGMLTITTDDADYGQLQIPVVVTKASESAVRCVLERVEMRLMSGASSASAVVRLRGTGDQAVCIAKLEASDVSVSCTWAPGPGNDATVKIHAGATTPPQSHVAVHFESAELPSIVIPVSMRTHD